MDKRTVQMACHLTETLKSLERKSNTHTRTRYGRIKQKPDRLAY